MLSDLRRLIDKVFYLVPVKHLNAAAAVVIAGLLLGIGNTLFNRHVTGLKGDETARAAPEQPIVARKKTVMVPASISEGNIFRKQRKNHSAPPPPPKKAVKSDDTVTDFKLLGTIVTDFARIAILDATHSKALKKPPIVNICGARVRVEKEKKSVMADSHSFHEGDYFFDYVIERVLEDRIEVVDLETGELRVVHMEMEEEVKGSPPPLAPKRVKKGKPVSDKKRSTPINISGAVTR